MVRIVLASAVARAEPTGLRYTAIPISTPITAATMVDCTTSLTCSQACNPSLLHRSATYSNRFMRRPRLSRQLLVKVRPPFRIAGRSATTATRSTLCNTRSKGPLTRQYDDSHKFCVSSHETCSLRPVRVSYSWRVSRRQDRHAALRGGRGGLLAISSAGLAISAHALAGGGFPDTALTIVLTALIGWIGTALAGKTRGPAGVLAILGTGQLAMHVVLTELMGHMSTSVPMFLAHCAATVTTAVLLAHAESM